MDSPITLNAHVKSLDSKYSTPEQRRLLAQALALTTPEQAELMAKELGQGKKKPIPLVPSWETMLALADKYEDRKTRFAYRFLLLSGQRVSEAIKTQRSHVSRTEVNGVNRLVIRSITEKNRSRPYRIIPIPLQGADKELGEEIWRSLQAMNPDDLIFGQVERSTLGKRLRKVSFNATKVRRTLTGETEFFEEPLKIYPHFLRHARATELGSRELMGVKELMDYFGWASPTMPNVYVQASENRLAKAVGSS